MQKYGMIKAPIITKTSLSRAKQCSLPPPFLNAKRPVNTIDQVFFDAERSHRCTDISRHCRGLINERNALQRSFSQWHSTYRWNSRSTRERIPSVDPILLVLLLVGEQHSVPLSISPLVKTNVPSNVRT